MTSLCEKTGHLIRLTKTDRGSGDQYAHCQICGCAVVNGSWNTPWKQPKENVLKKREWVGLTDEEVSKIIDAEIGFNSCWGPEEDFAKAIEAKLKEKNT
jgi:hypothetical protein